jgi:membrane protein
MFFLISISSLIPSGDEIQHAMLETVTRLIPDSQNLITRNIKQFVTLRGSTSLISLLILAWSGSKVLATLVDNINDIWPTTDRHRFLVPRLMSLTIILLLVVLLALSTLFSSALDILHDLGESSLGIDLSFSPATTGYFVSVWASWLVKFVVFCILYLWIPRTRVKWKAATLGALAATIGWELTTSAFTWYIGSGLANFHVIYGSLGAMAALMAWFYLSSIVILFGAALTSAIDQPPEDVFKRAKRS